MTRIKVVEKNGKKQRYVRVWYVDDFDFNEPKLEQLEKVKISSKYIRFLPSRPRANYGGFVDEQGIAVSDKFFFFKDEAVHEVGKYLSKFRAEANRLRNALQKLDTIIDDVLALPDDEL